jgi:hypothetical protein
VPDGSHSIESFMQSLLERAEDLLSRLAGLAGGTGDLLSGDEPGGEDGSCSDSDDRWGSGSATDCD